MRYMENLIEMTIAQLEALGSELDGNDYDAMLQLTHNIMKCTLQLNQIIKREKEDAERGRVIAHER